MSKMKVFEIKNLINEKYHGNIESKDIQNFLERKLGIKKTHSSNLEDHEVKAIMEHFAPAAKKTSETPATNKVPSANHSSEIGKELTSGKKPAAPASQGQVMPKANTPSQKRPDTQVTKPDAQGQRPRPEGQTGPQSGYPHQAGQGAPVQQQTRPSQGQTKAYHAGGGRTERPVMGRPDAQGQRSQGARPDYQGQRPQGARPDYQGQRPQGARPDYQGQRSQGARPDYQGQRPQGTRPDYQGQRPQGARPDYQGQRPQGTRHDAQGQRPQGMRQDGQNRPQQARPYGQTDQRGQKQGQGHQGYSQSQRDGRQPYKYNTEGQQGMPRQKNNTNQGNYQRPQGYQGGGQRGGFNRGFDAFAKDEDDKPAYGNRSGKKASGSQRPNERKDFDQKILDQKVAEKNDNRRSRDRLSKEKQYKEKNSSLRDIDDMSAILPKKGQFIKPKPVVEVKEEIKVITIPEVLTIKELAEKMRIPSAALIKKLFLAGKIVTINQEITFDEAEEIALEYDIISEKEIPVNEVEELLKEDEEDETKMVKRPPVVCVMGHVDHGKTSLLDAIRHANVTAREAGGITQHIGAYMVEIKGEKITFLDTPGHEAFTSMRMRGAQATDIAILVVAADDGVMPQTVEAISHAKAAGVKIIVAVNKIDKPSANVERVKQELTEYELIAEDWGGDTIFVPVSAHTKEGIEQLLEMILLTAELEELKANPDRMARGLVIEAELDKGRGPVATILVQKGTLHIGDNIAVGASYGKVRAMIDDKGRRVEEAGPSTPVEILGLNSVPDVGEIFMATTSEKEARTISEAFITQSKEKLISDTKAKLSLDGLFSQIQAGNIKELNLIIKADVQGSVEAMKQSLLKLSNDEVAVRVIHGGVGAINESDVILASTSNGIIIGFNVKPDTRAKETAEAQNVDIKLYRVIYNAISDVEAAMKGLLDPVFEEKIIGHAEVRQIFKASGIGTIAGSYVLDGKITRGSKVRIYRGNELIHEGNLGSLKRFQDDVKEVSAGYECGLVFEKFNDVKEEDKVEFYVMVEVPR
jgi:translation initiation factor IF-2